MVILNCLKVISQKNNGIIFKGNLHLSMKCLSIIHSNINYGNIAWASTFQTKLKKILTNPKHAVRIYFMKKKKLMQDLL